MSIDWSGPMPEIMWEVACGPGVPLNTWKFVVRQGVAPCDMTGKPTQKSAISVAKALFTIRPVSPVDLLVLHQLDSPVLCPAVG